MTTLLRHANPKLSPGPDGVPYDILYHLYPTTHHIMVTIFKKVLATNAVLALLGESMIKLKHKKGTIVHSPLNMDGSTL